MLWETAEETWRRNSALIVGVKVDIYNNRKIGLFYASKAQNSGQLAGGFEFYLN